MIIKNKLLKLLLIIFKHIITIFGHGWCLFIHDFILDEHKMEKPYSPQQCKICGRRWKL